MSYISTTTTATPQTFVRFVLACCIFLLPNIVQAETTNSATLQWEPNQEADLAGYKVYHGTAPGIYGSPQGVSKTNTTAPYSNLESNKSHYFAVTAYDEFGNESSPSSEVSTFIPEQDSDTEPPSLVPSLVSPLPGSTLTASPVTFDWSAGSGVEKYHLYVGTTLGGKDIYDQSQGTGTSVSVSGIPITGNPVYVRLWWKIAGTWSTTDYTYHTQGGDPALTSPTPGSTLTASPVTFDWSAGSGVEKYHLYVGTTPGGKDIYDQSPGTETSVSVSGIPITGNPVYVRLWWKIAGTWSTTDYTYHTQGGGGGDPALTSPTPGSTLTASPVTFDWSAGSGVEKYHLYVGTTPGGKDIYDQSPGTETSVSVSGIPINGNPVYVRLWWKIAGTWSTTDYMYHTQGGGGGDPTLTSPTPSSTLTASPVTFDWSAGSGVEKYHLYVGTTPGGKDIYDQSPGTATSVSVSGIPINGNPVYVRLWWKIAGTYSTTDYMYHTQGGGGGDPTLTSPTPSSTLTASPVTFDWSAGSGVEKYHLYVGTTPGGKDIYDQSPGTETSVSVSGIPINGNPVYVRLWWKIAGTYSNTDYTYQTQKDDSTPALVSPSADSTLLNSTVPFQWSAGSGVDEFFLGVGTSQAAIANAPWGNIFADSVGTKTYQWVRGIPLTGNPVFVRLWWKNGETWFFADYKYQTRKSRRR